MRVAEKIKAEIKKRDLSVTDAARVLDITRPAFSTVVNGRASLSVKLALKLEAKFGMNAKRLLMDQLKSEIAAARDEMERENV